MDNKPRIVVVGSYMQDLNFSVQAFPRPGETIFGQFRTGCGGKGANQAVAAVRSGVPTAFVGAVGGDAFGQQAEQMMKIEGIQAHLVRASVPTGCAGIFINADGENCIVIDAGANQKLGVSDLPSRLLQNAEIVVGQFECNLDATMEAFRIAKKAGAKTVLNPAPILQNIPEELLKLVDILVPNETEFVGMLTHWEICKTEGITPESLSELGNEKLHLLCRKVGVPNVIITAGEAGCFVSTRERWRLFPSFKVKKVVDTTGAGDAFVGGLAAGFVKFNHNLEKSIRHATATAALSVTRAGTSASMPKREEIERFLLDNPA